MQTTTTERRTILSHNDKLDVYVDIMTTMLRNKQQNRKLHGVECVNYMADIATASLYNRGFNIDIDYSIVFECFPELSIESMNTNSYVENLKYLSKIISTMSKYSKRYIICTSK